MQQFPGPPENPFQSQPYAEINCLVRIVIYYSVLNISSCVYSMVLILPVTVGPSEVILEADIDEVICFYGFCWIQIVDIYKETCLDFENK